MPWKTTLRKATLSGFITDHLDEIVGEWETFARTLSPASATMDSLALRDHARQILEAIARDITTSQSLEQQELKSKGLGPVFKGPETAAAAHGALRHTVGFDLRQLVAEFRALRATVLRLWLRSKRYEDPEGAYEIARFNEAVDQALAESVESYSRELSKSRDTFLAILGHDLRSPLSAMSGALHILSKPATDTQRLAALGAGFRSVSFMSGMIRDLLEYTRTRLGKGIPIAPEEANLEAVCKSAISELSLVYPEVGFRFESRGALNGFFDPERMQQVVSNLLNNAVQHGKRGFPVSLIAQGEAASLSLQVTNRGEPIAAESLQVIFDPLVQLSPEGSAPRLSTNLGLGLFIAREIVVSHGGTIRATSSARDGTTFFAELPRSGRKAN
jgi:signal transduction histidine kinase